MTDVLKITMEVFEIMSSTMKELKSKLDDSKNFSELMKTQSEKSKVNEKCPKRFLPIIF